MIKLTKVQERELLAALDNGGELLGINGRTFTALEAKGLAESYRRTREAPTSLRLTTPGMWVARTLEATQTGEPVATDTQIDLFAAVEAARMAHYALATTEDHDDEAYAASTVTFMEAIRAAYPDEDAAAVYALWLDNSESIAYQVGYLQDAREEAAIEQASWDAFIRRTQEATDALTLPQRLALVSMEDNYGTPYGDTNTLAALADRKITRHENGRTRLTALGMDVRMTLLEAGVTPATIKAEQEAERAAKVANEPTDARLIQLIGAWRDLSDIPTGFTFGAPAAVGDIAILASRGMWRRGVVIKVGRVAVTVVYTTQGAADAHGNGFQLTRSHKAEPFARVAIMPATEEITPQGVAMVDVEDDPYRDAAANLTSDQSAILTAMSDGRDVVIGAPDILQGLADLKITRPYRGDWYLTPYGTAVRRSLLDTPQDVAMVDTVPDVPEWHEYDRAEHEAVWRDYVAEYGPEIEAEAREAATVAVVTSGTEWLRRQAAAWKRANRATPKARRPRGRARVGAR